MFKYQGWSFMGEWIVRSTKDPILEAEIPVFDGHGYSIQGGYLLDNNMELALRLAVTEPNISIQDKVNSVEEYTFGLNKYIAQYSLKIQGDVSYRLSTGIEPSHSIQSRLQVTINF
jgi:phosphate-selective porin OprO and OprP